MGSRISPTAHYTGHVWVRKGLANPALDTPLGRAMHLAWRPINGLVRPLVGGATLEQYLLDRHLMLDMLLTRAIEENGATQVLEVASGLSPRGSTFASKYPDITYLEADLAPMAVRKQALLDRMGLGLAGAKGGSNHRVVTLDLLQRGSRQSLMAVIEEHLDPDRTTVIIAEGLLSYFDRPTLMSLWPRIREALDVFPRGLFLANMELESEAGAWSLVRAFVAALGFAVSAPAHLCFKDEAEAREVLREARFDYVELHRPKDLLQSSPGPTMVRALEAWLRYTHRS